MSNQNDDTSADPRVIDLEAEEIRNEPDAATSAGEETRDEPAPAYAPPAAAKPLATAPVPAGEIPAADEVLPPASKVAVTVDQITKPGAIISGNTGTPQSKVDALLNAGAKVADRTSDVPGLLKEVLPSLVTA